MNKGKFIVFDGSDGSGKQTQMEMLSEYLRKKGERVFNIEFPNYEVNFHGKILKEVLRGKFGDFLSLSPYSASFLYVADRFESVGEIKKRLEAGETILCDRFTTSNMIHQGGKFKDKKERKEYLDWLWGLEFEYLGFPKPDVVFFLKVPVDISIELLASKKRDISEDSRPYLENSLQCASEIAGDYGWEVVNCVEDGKMRIREDIHKEIVKRFEDLNK